MENLTDRTGPNTNHIDQAGKFIHLFHSLRSIWEEGERSRFLEDISQKIHLLKKEDFSETTEVIVFQKTVAEQNQLA
jgi:hypothetical protein